MGLNTQSVILHPVLRRLPLANPDSRFERYAREYDESEAPEQGLTLIEDQSRSILSENRSPDLPFRFSLNAYRGCAHGCSYCYARPTHEYLGYGAGSDFERVLFYKPHAATLLREAFERKSWGGHLIAISGNTDAYQPLEASMKLTRSCLEVCLEYRNPVHIITKSALVERDLDLLTKLHEVASVGISVSVTFWDPDKARLVEPYAPPPLRRVETIRRLAERGLPVMVHVAPLIPGLSDAELIPILEACKGAGATAALAIPLRLPGSTRAVFIERLERDFPGLAPKVVRRVTEMRGGQLNDPRFFSRFRAQGTYAESLEQIFRATAQRLGYAPFPSARLGTFMRPERPGHQLSLFERGR